LINGQNDSMELPFEIQWTKRVSHIVLISF